MLIEVVLALILLGFVITLGWYLTVVRRHRPTISEEINKVQEPASLADISIDTSIQIEEGDGTQHDGPLDSVEVEPKGRIAVEVLPSANEKVKGTSTEIQQLTEVEASIPQQPIKNEMSSEENNCISDTNMNAKEVGLLDGTNDDLDENEDEKAKQGERRHPEDRGGQPRGIQNKNGDKVSACHQHCPRPEIVCWKREREWLLGIEIPEEQQNAAEIWIFQERELLSPDEFKEGCWRLIELKGEIGIHTSDGEVEIDLGESNYLVFKLSGTDLTQGRLVKQPGNGSYLVIMPEDWKRDEEFAGTAPATPEPVCLDGYRAHFFDLMGENSSKILFKDSNGDKIEVYFGEPQFVLMGHQLHDVSERLGPLFGCSPPTMHIANVKWANVGTIVIGEEGNGRGRWRKSFESNSVTSEQAFPSSIVNEIVNRKAGWYFVRFYNSTDQLIDSMDFRFVAGLSAITVHETPALPTAGRHGEVKVEFCCEEDCSIEPLNLKDLKVDNLDGKVIVVIPAYPECDRSHWLVGYDNHKVPITVLLERVWWALNEENQTPSKWQDNVISLRREEFTSTSSKAIWVRLPTLRWVDSISVGFAKERARVCHPESMKSTIVIPIREFVDSQAMLDLAHQHHLILWIKRFDKLEQVEIGYFPIISLPLPPRMPKISIPFTVRSFITYLLRQPWFIDELRNAIRRLEQSAPDHCRNELAIWREELRKNKHDFNSIWLGLRAIDRYLHPKPNWLANLEVPEAARIDIFNADRILDRWWTGH